MILNINEDIVKGKVKDIKALIQTLDYEEEYNDLLQLLKLYNDNDKIIVNNNNGMGFTIKKDK